MAASEVDICGTCNKNINLTDCKGLKCRGTCRKTFHITCANVKAKDYAKFTKPFGEKWNCSQCTKRRRSDSSPNNKMTKKNKTEGEESEESEKESDESMNESESVSVQLRKIVKMIKTQGKEHKKQIKDLKSVCIERMDGLQQQITENADDIIDLRNENAELRKQIVSMQSDINVINQQKLADTIEIAGVIETKGENLNEIVTKVAMAAKVNLNNNNITNVYRKKNGKIITKFTTSEKANEMVSASFKTQLTNTMIGKAPDKNGSGSSQQTAKSNNGGIRIYMNNALTTLNQLLYKRLRDLKKDTKIIKFTFRNSYFSVKEKENARFTAVYNEQHLAKFNDI